jgi:hypothetical protein
MAFPGGITWHIYRGQRLDPPTHGRSARLEIIARLYGGVATGRSQDAAWQAETKDGMNDQIPKTRTKFEHHTIYFAMLCRSR